MKNNLVWIIDDDEYNAKRLRRDVMEFDPAATGQIFGDAMAACRATGSPAVIVVDLSSVGSIAGGPELSYSAIANISGKHPGAVIVIRSAVSKNFAEYVRELVVDDCPDSVVRLMEVFDDLSKVLGEFLTPATLGGGEQ